MGLAAYRIVQEALTNVLKHAGPVARAAVQILWEADAVRITVDDDGRGASAASDGRGQGVGGMQERARLYGGRVEAAPRPGGGYRVQALLPYPGSPAPAVVRMSGWGAAPQPPPAPPPAPTPRLPHQLGSAGSDTEGIDHGTG